MNAQGAVLLSTEQAHFSSLGSWPAARVHLFGPAVPGWRLENPLPISVERDTDHRFVVSDDIFNVYGVGESWDAAVGDYAVALVEFFEITNDGHDEQSRQLLEHLKRYLRRG